MLIFWLFLRFEPDLSWSTVVIDAGEMPRPRLIRNLGSSYKVIKTYVTPYPMKNIYTVFDKSHASPSFNLLYSIKFDISRNDASLPLGPFLLSLDLSPFHQELLACFHDAGVDVDGY